jgi:hypothetical protein
MAWCSISEFGRREASKGQVNIRWMMEFWKTLTVLVSLDVQQDVVPVEKAELKCAGLCSCGENFLPTSLAMTLDSMAYLKNNDGNALRYYLRSAADQYLFIYSIFSFGSTVFIL